MILRITLAAFLGGALGLERDVHGRAAGLRTHLLVSTGAALFMILSIYMGTFGPEALKGVTRVSDPGRIAAQIVTGIGFLGAGAIIKEGFTIRGLTTAACLWISAAIGMSAGAGFYLLAFYTTVIALLSLILLRRFERFYTKDVYRSLEISIPAGIDVSRIIDIIHHEKVKILSYDYERDYEKKMTTVHISLRFTRKGDVDRLSHDLIKTFESSNIPMKSIRWTHL